MKLIKLILPIIFIAAILMLSACPNALEPFNPAVVDQAKDANAPVVELSTPIADSVYSQIVTVSGVVTDDGALMPDLSYSVSDSLGSQKKTGEIELTQLETAEGIKAAFSFNFTTSEYSSDILFEISGTDWNGNTSAPIKLRLVFSGNTIPSFTVSATSKNITCSWDEVEGATSYKIMYTTDGSIPQESYGESSPLLTAAASNAPYVISGLSNGHPHVVRLIAYGDDGKSWNSEFKTVIPLSELSLRPKTFAGNGEIQLEWFKMSDAYGYEVYRSESVDGNPINISGTIMTNSFTDSRVNDDIDYYYYIRPALSGAVMSAGSSCRSFPLSSNNDRSISTVSDLKNIRQLKVAGTKAYLLDNDGDLYIYDISDSEFPVLLGSWDHPSPVTGWDCRLDVDGDYAYISKSYYIYAVDISNSSNPVLIDTVQPDGVISPTKAFVDDVCIRGSFLYASVCYQSTDAQEGVYCYTIEADGSLDLASGWYEPYDFPITAEFCSDNNGSGDLYISYCHSTAYPTGVIRVTPSGTITNFIDPITPAEGNDFTYYHGVIVDNSKDLIACVVKTATSYYLRYYKISTGETFGAGEAIEGTSYKGGYIDDEMLFLAMDYYAYTYMLSLSGSEYSARNLYKTQTQYETVGIGASGDITVCGTEEGLQLLNSRRKPASQSLLVGIDVNASAIDVAGELVYAAENIPAGSLAVYSFADKSNPVLLGRTADFNSGSINDIISAGNYVFLLTSYQGENGVFAVDVSNPASMSVVGSFFFGSVPEGVDLMGDYLTVFCDGFVEILDVADPSSISLVSRTMITNGASGDVEIKGNYLFAGFDDYSPSSGLTVLDIANPAEPVIKKELTAVQMRRIAISGDRLYGYSQFQELVVFDISNPEEPMHLQDISCLINGANPLADPGLDAVENYLVFHGISDGENDLDDGIHIYNTENISTTDRLEFLDLYDEGAGEEGFGGRLQISGRYLYMAADKLFCFNIAP